ncbi:MAG: 3-dehydroquinate synthase [Candidatus Marinimicrobia bacterium]|nr:3-dehydroquinate synthase [Candidatus Neomarinimicrobiota bacterium]
MKTIQVNLGQRSYPIHVESGLLKEIPSILSIKNQGQKWVIIAQQGIIDRYGNALSDQLSEAGFDTLTIDIPTGENAKSFDEYQIILSRMVEAGCDRSSIILALGGGVTGDLAGFAAATFMRGVDYFQIPTTLLAMVDSSIGGKTGINIAEGKNLIGVIHQPKAVLIDPEILHSLPKEEITSGLGEIIKYGAIRDKAFLTSISLWLDDINTFPFEKAIIHSCEIKAAIVSKDEREGDLRRILNFGHTIGHALEAYYGYGEMRHGDAVSYGMICGGWISNQLGYLSKHDYQNLKDIIQKLPLQSLNKFDPNQIISFIKNDKKIISGQLHFVILNGLGSAAITKNVAHDIILESLKEIQ